MVAEAIYFNVPNRTKHVDEQRLAQWNPNGIYGQVAAGEIRQVKVSAYDDGFGVFAQPVVEGTALRFARYGNQAFASPLGDGLAYVNRNVLRSLALVKRMWPRVVDDLHASAYK